MFTSDSRGIFGVPLRQSITYANVAISLVDENGESYIYGYVPIVVAKCGVFLKEKGRHSRGIQIHDDTNRITATNIEGIFRLSGSEKRIKELKNIFDSPDRYGKGLVWDGYTVHDASNVLRRYLNDLPEPVVPLALYERFRQPLRGATKQAVGDTEGPQFVENFDEKKAIETYQRLITELPPLNKQLLLYILDLLAVFAAKADENRMTSQNLAAIFQPGMLSHPNHAMAPEEYRLNQCVIIFLIENQDHFLIGMQGTEADEKTVKEVQAGNTTGPLTPTPKSGGGVNRSSSNASAGADSVRREGQIRRNRSVNSRHSRQGSAPSSPALAATPTGGLARSNTVPSKKSPAVSGGKFRHKDNLEPLTQAHPVESLQVPSEKPSLAPSLGVTTHLTPEVASTAGRSQERLLGSPEASTPHKEKSLPSIFQRSPTDESKRQPKKLKKKRLPDSIHHSAHSSTASLPQVSAALSNSQEMPNPLEQTQFANAEEAKSQPSPTSHPAPTEVSTTTETPSESTPRASQVPSNATRQSDDKSILNANKSPPASMHSSYHDGSEFDGPEGEKLSSAVSGTSDVTDKEKKRRWRISSRGKHGHESPRVLSPERNLGNEHADLSTTSFGSASKARKSFTGDSGDVSIALASIDSQNDSGRDEHKGAMEWIKNKIKRTKSPPADEKERGINAFLARGKSLDIKGEARDEEKQAPATTLAVSGAPTSVVVATSETPIASPQPRVPMQGHPIALTPGQATQEPPAVIAQAASPVVDVPESIPEEPTQQATKTEHTPATDVSVPSAPAEKPAEKSIQESAKESVKEPVNAADPAPVDDTTSASTGVKETGSKFVEVKDAELAAEPADTKLEQKEEKA